MYFITTPFVRTVKAILQSFTHVMININDHVVVYLVSTCFGNEIPVFGLNTPKCSGHFTTMFSRYRKYLLILNLNKKMVWYL